MSRPIIASSSVGNCHRGGRGFNFATLGIAGNVCPCVIHYNYYYVVATGAGAEGLCCQALTGLINLFSLD